ncbi:MAG: hypothetical protein DRG40_01590 [Deltaproteobacteria bacterium]|nr:MAG: hypothetical protein DRG40_01590 [Deltaproteobacteria bacterium]
MAKGVLKCKKFGIEMEYDEAMCPRPDEYCEYRDRCGIYFLTQERMHEKKKKEVREDASL